ncbi:MAG TPA: FAD:protein FMN transferase [Gemmataceae bacterium]|nr:FAD:protein FMN transferase [Gemmataceae bacterium]
MNRREFLQPHRLIAAEPSRETALLRLARRAMATNFEIILPYNSDAALAHGQAAFDQLDQLEDQLTVYREHSEVCRLNRTAFHAPVPVERGLFELLQTAARITAETESAFDVTAGALIKAWGFFRGPRRVPSDAEREAALERVGVHWVDLDVERRTVAYRRRGLEINLGSIGKGYALDRVGDFLTATGKISAVLLHGGHSSVYARGSPNDDPRGWRVGISHPWESGRRLAEVWLRDCSLGTSAATFQYLEHSGRKLGHVLDPRTGWPAAGMASASVVAPTGAEADALSTAFYVGGVETARRYCAAHPEVGAVLLPEGDGAAPVIFNLAF